MRELTRAGMHSRTLMEWVLRIMANLLRPDELGPAEAAYKAARPSCGSHPTPRSVRDPLRHGLSAYLMSVARAPSLSAG